MAAKSGMRYRTKNRDALVAYLQSREGEHVTVNEIHDHFRQAGSSMGLATIYRQLEQLVGEGHMRKYVVDSGSAACFEYVNPVSCMEPRCYHLKCRQCGKLVHLNCNDIDALVAHIQEKHGFLIDMNRTVFYGKCDACSKELSEF